MDKETKKALIGDGRELVYMGIGAVAGLLAALPFTDVRANIIACGIIGMVSAQIFNRLQRRRERKTSENRP